LKLSEVTKAQARASAFVVAGALLLIAAWNFYRGRMIVAIVLGGSAFALVLMALLLPALARRFHVGWMKVAGFLSIVRPIQSGSAPAGPRSFESPQTRTRELLDSA
jgi:hypothetical protein